MSRWMVKHNSYMPWRFVDFRIKFINIWKSTTGKPFCTAEQSKAKLITCNIIGFSLLVGNSNKSIKWVTKSGRTVISFNNITQFSLNTCILSTFNEHSCVHIENVHYLQMLDGSFKVHAYNYYAICRALKRIFAINSCINCRQRNFDIEWIWIALCQAFV